MSQLFPSLPMDPRYPIIHLKILAPLIREPDEATFLADEVREVWRPREKG